MIFIFYIPDIDNHGSGLIALKINQIFAHKNVKILKQLKTNSQILTFSSIRTKTKNKTSQFKNKLK